MIRAIHEALVKGAMLETEQVADFVDHRLAGLSKTLMFLVLMLVGLD